MSDSEDYRSLVLLGTDWMKIACVRSTGIYGLMSAIGASVGYHLLTSRQPALVFSATLVSFTLPYWIHCRKEHRDRLSEVRVVKVAMKGEGGGPNQYNKDELPVWTPSVTKDSS